MFRILMFSGVAAFFVIVAPTAVAGQSELCDACAYDDGEHWFLGVNCDGGGACKDCEYDPPNCLAGCHAKRVDGSCGLHALCAPEAPADEELLALVERRAVDVIARLVGKGAITLNVQRGALQVAGCCEKTVLTHLPIPTDLVEEVAAVLNG